MKKKYIHPETVIIELEKYFPLLAGSIDEELQEEQIEDADFII